MNNKIFIPLCLLITACASIQSPSGGDKDTTAPVIATDSTVLTINSTPGIIRFDFDEHTTINTSLISINPAILPEPMFKVKNKSLEIIIEADSLETNTTYSIDLNESIKDLNEGNIGNYHTFLFSTGSIIDSNVLKLILPNLIEKEKVELQFKTRNLFYTYLLTKENNRITGIPHSLGDYTAFIDKNNNKTFDPQEKGNMFSGKTDSLSLILIEPNTKIIKVKRNGPLIYLLGLPLNATSQLNGTVFSDTLLLDDWSDTSKLNKSFYTISSNIDSSSAYSHSSIAPRSNKDTNTVKIEFNFNISAINKDSILITEGTDTLTNYTLDFSKNILRVIHKGKITSGTVVFKHNAVSYNDVLANQNKILPYSYNPSPIAKLKNTHNYELSVLLYNSKNKLYKFIRIPANGSQEIELIKDTYHAVSFNDINNDYHLNHPLENTMKEPVFMLKNIGLISNLINVVNL